MERILIVEDEAAILIPWPTTSGSRDTR